MFSEQKYHFMFLDGCIICHLEGDTVLQRNDIFGQGAGVAFLFTRTTSGDFLGRGPTFAYRLEINISHDRFNEMYERTLPFSFRESELKRKYLRLPWGRHVPIHKIRFIMPSAGKILIHDESGYVYEMPGCYHSSVMARMSEFLM